MVASSEADNSPGIRDRLRGINPLVVLLVLCFAFSSWIDLLGVWVELPILVHRLPEGWTLPSYVIVLIQCAMITPLVYTLVNKLCPGNIKKREVVMAYIIMSVGLVALVLLTIFWHRTVYVAGAERSLAAILLILFLAMVDTTSCVVYLPYMANFKEQYIPAYVAGEETGGLITGMVGLIQGAGGHATCFNETIHVMNETTGLNYTETIMKITFKEPRFSVSVFFVFLTFMMALSIFSFSLLNFAKFAKKEKVSIVEPSYSKVPINDNGVTQYDPEVLEKYPFENSEGHCTKINKKDSQDQQQNGTLQGKEAAESHASQTMAIPRMAFCLGSILWSAFLLYGIFPSLQSFSSLPYGPLAYTLGVRLMCVINPIAAFTAFFLPMRSLRKLAVLITLSTLIALYHVFLASQSPHPPLKEHIMGSILVVGTVVIMGASFAYARANLASVLRREGGHQALYYAGGCIQMGCFVGGTTGFLLVNVFKLFKSIPMCSE